MRDSYPAHNPYASEHRALQQETKIMREYYLAYNSYASETDCGFANTWKVYRVASRAELQRILRENEHHWGYRIATPAEIREAKQAAERHGGYIEAWED